MNLCVIVVAYYLKDDSLMDLISNIFKKVNPDDVIVVFNRDFFIEMSCNKKNLHLIKGSNKLLDMSGYFEGLTYAKNTLNYKDNDIAILLNDSLTHKHPYNIILRYAKENISNFKELNFFYSGIPKTIKTNVKSLRFFPTYFIVTNFATIDLLTYEILYKYKCYRREFNPFIKQIFDYSWRPQTKTGDLVQLLLKKQRCVFIEMTLSSIASKENFFIEYQNFYVIKFFRLLIKIKNFVRKRINNFLKNFGS